MAEVERSKSMWTNVDTALESMEMQLSSLMGDAEAKAFVAKLETLITELVKAPPRGKNHPSRNKA